jgi:dienelactone hydrolase
MLGVLKVEICVPRCHDRNRGKVPGVIVIVEVFRVNRLAPEVTHRLLSKEYVAATPALYHRLGSNSL